MKQAYFVAVLVLTVTEILAMSDEMKELMAMLHNGCRDDLGLEEAVIAKAQKGDFEEGNEKLQCYMKCTFVQAGAMTEEGAFDADAAVGGLPPELADKVSDAIHKCGKEVGGNPCNTAMKINQCFFKESKFYFLI